VQAYTVLRTPAFVLERQYIFDTPQSDYFPTLPTPAVSPKGFGFGELPLKPHDNRITTGLGFMPKISFAPRPTEASPWPAFDAITIPPAQDLPSFLTHRPQVLCPHLYLAPTGRPAPLPKHTTQIGQWAIPSLIRQRLRQTQLRRNC
jgi:hypothetical protein